MDDELFGRWVSDHIAAAGRGGEMDLRIREMLWANRKVLVDHNHATFAELCECSDRLIGGNRIPEYLDQLASAIVRELRYVREDAARLSKTRDQRVTYGRGHGGDCPCVGCAEKRGEPAAIATRARLKAMLGQIGERP